MSEAKHLDKPPVEPVWHQDSPSAQIDFGYHQLSVSEDAVSDSGTLTGNARLRFTPRDSLEFVVPPVAPKTSAEQLRALVGLGVDEVTLKLLDYGTSIEAFATSSNSERSIYVPSRSPVQVYPPSTKISRAVLHLLNWPDFRGPENYVLELGTPPRRRAASCGQFFLEVDDWNVLIAATGDTRSAVKALRDLGGFMITHAGVIKRADGRDFSSEQLDEFLAFLSYFFSFVHGCWAGPNLTVGFDSFGNRVYEQWGLGRCASGPWDGSRSWFDRNHAEMFPDVLPGFWNLWKSSVWHQPLTEIIYWYISANGVGGGLGVDSAILFTQAALELLSWTHCVLDKQTLSRTQFRKKLSAAEKLRVAISSLGIPLQIPPHLTALHAIPGRSTSSNDSMDVITILRNGLVHPENPTAIPGDAYYDAWRLSLWFIELMLLGLCSYSGGYANRLSQRFVGQIEPVPWAT